jgi:hypothetical protein
VRFKKKICLFYFILFYSYFRRPAFALLFNQLDQLVEGRLLVDPLLLERLDGGRQSLLIVKAIPGKRYHLVDNNLAYRVVLALRLRAPAATVRGVQRRDQRQAA